MSDIANEGMSSTVVLATRDVQSVQAIAGRLAESGLRLLTTDEASGALKAVAEHRPNLFIIDASHPVGDVLALCRALRAITEAPIVALLAAGMEGLDEATVLDAGVDDCMSHPVSHRELVARVRAHLRRGSRRADGVPRGLIKLGDLEISVGAHKVSRQGSLVNLTPLEFKLLLYLVRNRGKVLTRVQLLKDVWGWDYATSTRTVDVRIRLLRKKIETDPDHPRFVATVIGLGYRFDG